VSDGFLTSELARVREPGLVPRRGTLTLRRVHGDAALCYYVYVPESRLRTQMPVLVSVHGISRNAREHGRAFAAFAEHYGLAIVLPLFTKDFYPDFQRLGIDGGRHPDTALDAMLADVGALLGIDAGRFTLFGYSGGAQFAHRYALVNPERVAALVLASAGWYTWPTDERAFPLGLPANPLRPELVCRLDGFLAIPLCVLIGARDTERDHSLRRSRWIDRFQGRNRLERARAWFAELQRIAASRGIQRQAELCVLEAADHDFVDAVERDAINRRAVEFLYGTARRGVDKRASLGVPI
jgi:pimeloyl-ACP methyl ester carboxylesterase